MIKEVISCTDTHIVIQLVHILPMDTEVLTEDTEVLAEDADTDGALL